MINAALLVIYVVISTYGLYMLKSAPTPLSVPFVLGFAAYAAGFLMWLYLLMRLPLSIVFPVAAGGLIISTQLAGFWLLGEKTSSVQIAGVALVLTGIVLIYTKA